MSHAYARLYYHLIFSTKNRLPHITPDIQDRLYGYMKGIVCNLDGVVEEIGGIDDHVICCCTFRPNLPFPTRSKPSRRIRQNGCTKNSPIDKNSPGNEGTGFSR